MLKLALNGDLSVQIPWIVRVLLLVWKSGIKLSETDRCLMRIPNAKLS